MRDEWKRSDHTVETDASFSHGSGSDAYIPSSRTDTLPDAESLPREERENALFPPQMGPMQAGADLRAQEIETVMSGGESQRDPEAGFLADAVRRAHDEELAALASLALIRSGMAQRGRQSGERGRERRDLPLSQEELNERLRKILDDSDSPST